MTYPETFTKITPESKKKQEEEEKKEVKTLVKKIKVIASLDYSLDGGEEGDRLIHACRAFLDHYH